MPRWVEKKEYAKSRGWSRTYLYRKIKELGISTQGTKIDAAAADRLFQKSSDPARAKFRKAGGEIGGDVSFSKARAKREMYRAAMEQLAYERTIGSLVDIQKVEAEAFRTGRMVRDAMLNIPSRICGVVAAETDQRKIHEILTGEIRQALEGLNEGKPRTGRAEQV